MTDEKSTEEVSLKQRLDDEIDQHNKLAERLAQANQAVSSLQQEIVASRARIQLLDELNGPEEAPEEQ